MRSSAVTISFATFSDAAKYSWVQAEHHNTNFLYPLIDPEVSLKNTKVRNYDVLLEPKEYFAASEKVANEIVTALDRIPPE